MSIRFFNIGLISICILALTACASSTPASTSTPSAPAPSAADIDKEEQAIYSFFVSEKKGVALILQETSTGLPSDDPQQMTDFFQSNFPGVSAETIARFKERNQQGSQLTPGMNLGVDYKLLNAEELKQITSQPNWGETLNEKYPNSGGYIIFSRVGFNSALDQAVVYVGEVMGPLMGSGYFYLMEKQNGKWGIKEKVMTWIS